MADFIPPPLSSHEGPARFTPPPLSAHEGPAKIPGMERLGALPGAAAAPIPGKLDSTTKDPRGLLRRTYERDVDALAAVAGGASRGINAKTRDEAAGGLHDAIGGGMTLAEPLLGAGLAAAPLAALTGLATGAGGGKLAQMGSSAAGATENEAALAGDIGGLLAGAGGVKAAGVLPRALPVIRGGLSGLANGLSEAAPEMIEKLPIIRALGPLKNVPAAVVDAVAKQRAAANGGLTPAQDTILQRYLQKNPGPMSLQDLSEISPQDLAAPADPTTAKAQESPPLRPEIQAILDEANRPAGPGPAPASNQYMPMVNRGGDFIADPRATNGLADGARPVASVVRPPTNLAELADPATLQQAAQPQPADPNLTGQLADILGRLREQNPGFDGPPEPPPLSLEEQLQQSLDAVKAKKLAPGPGAFNPKERGSFSLKSLAGDLAGDSTAPASEEIAPGDKSAQNGPMQTVYRATNKGKDPLAFNPHGILYTTPEASYAENWGDVHKLEASPKNTLDLTRLGHDDVSAKRFMRALEREGVDIPEKLKDQLEGIEEDTGGEPLAYFGRAGKALREAIQAAGFDSAKIHEYVEGDSNGATPSLMLFHPEHIRKAK